MWCLTVGEQTSSPSEPTTRYITPVITQVLGAGTNRARTEGGDYILLQGDYFGPLDTIDFSYIMVEYGYTASEYAAVDCTLRAAQYQIERSEEHTSELQSLMRISYAVFCLKTKK